MHNIPLILYLGKNLREYGNLSADRSTLTTLINQAFPLNRLHRHKSACGAEATTKLKYHGSYWRTKIITTTGERHSVQTHRVYCPKCRATWAV